MKSDIFQNEQWKKELKKSIHILFKFAENDKSGQIKLDKTLAWLSSKYHR